MSEYSDDSVKKRPQPTRWSVRNRKTVVDPDFSKQHDSMIFINFYLLILVSSMMKRYLLIFVYLFIFHISE